MSKPQKSKADGVGFPDPGLHLAVLGALMDGGLVEAQAIQSALDGIDPDLDEQQRITEAVRRLCAIRLDPANLATVTSLNFDGGNEIYTLLEDSIDVDTGGETDDYSLRSLAGINALSSLAHLDLDGHGYCPNEFDLAPLADHPALQTLALTSDCTHANALETLPSLKKLELRTGSLDTPGVLVRLRARGVIIQN